MEVLEQDMVQYIQEDLDFVDKIGEEQDNFQGGLYDGAAPIYEDSAIYK